MITIVPVCTSYQYAAAARLFTQYAQHIGVDLAFQNFAAELLQLQNMYSPPTGIILLAKYKGKFIGCIALRKKETNIAELKRMYVLPSHKNKGVGQALLEASILKATQLGYQKIWLDTLATMLPAMHLYTKNGFYEIPAYYFNPNKNALFYELII